MKLNLKSTIAAPAGNKSGQRALNGIIGNTRRGIVVDQTLDPDSNNPVSNKPVSTALTALAGKIDAALQKPTGLTKTELVGVGANGQENIEIGDNLTLANGKLSAIGGGVGKSVPPTLWLIDADKLKARTTITEEEYNNLKNQLYNQVIYFPDTDYNDAYYLSKLVYVFDTFYFVQCHGVYDDALNNDRIVSLIQYEITIGEKDTSGNYPITIKKADVMPFGGGSGGSGGITPKPITSTADYASLTDTDYFISVNITDNSNVKNGTYILSGNKANGYSYWYPEDKSEGLNMQTYWHYIHYDSTGLTAIIFTSFLDINDNNKVGFSFNSKFPDNNIFGGLAVRQVPLFSKYTLVTNTTDEITPILPCTTADNGKVLSVVNGEAQWATPASGGVSVTFED